MKSMIAGSKQFSKSVEVEQSRDHVLARTRPMNNTVRERGFLIGIEFAVSQF